ncbi:8633_t:CDS:2 [Acaulospora morrowiae]|uniref:Lysine--tRNA ligase n=1 Tax=Acaulospora morrowiae TaxID=94023 RepID=A0A9N8WNH7_9GLOM|nr:8633_t:CDS:2 [Acaulospora morrowiae]
MFPKTTRVLVAKKGYSPVSLRYLNASRKQPPSINSLRKSSNQLHSPGSYFDNRSKIINEFRVNNNPNPYPHKFRVDLSIPEFVQEYNNIEPNQRLEQEVLSIAGRVHSWRSSGTKLFFYDLHGEGAKIQITARAQDFERDFDRIHKIIRRGDIVGVRGFPGRTKSGELSIYPRDMVLLSPCLHQLPTPQQGFKDQNTRYHQRYLDLIMNNSTREKFITRTKIINHIRQFLNGLGFLEVETPMMTAIASGAAARTFVTRHADFKRDLFMRVAPELYLKQLVVGGLERVYEIGRQFRNESIDVVHNPEFTSCEFYMAYADMYDLMDMTEKMLSELVMLITGSPVVKYHPNGSEDGKELALNFTPPFPRLDVISCLEKTLEVKFPPSEEWNTDATNQFLKNICDKHNIKCSPPRITSRLLDKASILISKLIQPKCISPTFLTGHPQLMCPLAKHHREKPGLSERFELFVASHELINAYTELNDPFDQRERFKEQARNKDKGDQEAQLIDESFCTSLEYGLPPTAGWGLGIDRLAMILTDSITIKEVLLFPALSHGRTCEE